MIRGIFVENTPFVQVAVEKNGKTVSPFFILDTGFSGDLQLTPEIASEIGLSVDNATFSHIANDSVVEVPVSFAMARMGKSVNDMEIIVSPGPLLIGINFLTKFGYVTTIDCALRTISLEQSAVK